MIGRPGRPRGVRRRAAGRGRACPRSPAGPSRACDARTRRRSGRIRSSGMGGVWSPSSARYRSDGIIRFLAHSISPASSRRGRNLCGGGNAFASDEMSGALWSSTCGSGSPVCEDQSRESCESAAEWKVRASTPPTPSASSRRFSSPAAFSVNVTARICDASNAPLRTWHAIRRVIVVVLPVPAPATMATGPRSARAASRCESFSPVRTLSTSGTSLRLAPGPDGPQGSIIYEASPDGA